MRTLLLVPTVLAMLHGNAQVHLGVRAGASLAKQVMETSPGYTGYNFQDDHKYNLYGFSTAITAELPIAGALHLMLEANYSERGYKTKYVISLIPNNLLKTGNAGLSILPTARLGKGKCKLEVFAGADLSKRLGVRDNSRGDIIAWEADAIFKGLPRTRESLMAGSSLALIAGAGVAIRMGPSMLHLNARYLYGISNVYAGAIAFTDPNGYPFGTGEVFDRAFVVSLGCSIPLSATAWNPSPSN